MFRKAQLKLLLAVFVCALVTLAPPAQATVYSFWVPYTDNRDFTPVSCRMRSSADVYYPLYGAVYRPTTGSGLNGRASVPHASFHGFRLEALQSLGLGSALISMVGDLSRWDTGGNFWRYFNSLMISGWFPPYEGPMYYQTTRRNPYNTGGAYYDWVYVSPGSETHFCDAYTSITNLEIGYVTASCQERNPYYVRW